MPVAEVLRGGGGGEFDAGGTVSVLPTLRNSARKGTRRERWRKPCWRSCWCSRGDRTRCPICRGCAISPGCASGSRAGPRRRQRRNRDRPCCWSLAVRVVRVDPGRARQRAVRTSAVRVRGDHAVLLPGPRELDADVDAGPEKRPIAISARHAAQALRPDPARSTAAVRSHTRSSSPSFASALIALVRRAVLVRGVGSSAGALGYRMIQLLARNRAFRGRPRRSATRSARNAPRVFFTGRPRI